MDTSIIVAIIAGGCTLTGSLGAAWLAHRRKGRDRMPPSLRASHTSLPNIVVPGRPRVLVVDDERSFGRAIRHLLNERGCDVDVALTCAEARALVSIHPYTLHIVDLGLPDGDGLALLADLAPRRLVYSGASEEQLDRARTSGVADRVLEKDGDLATLEAVVVELLRMSSP